MKCKRCGTEGSPGAIFCLNCGMALPKEEEASTSNKTMILGSENRSGPAEPDSGRTMVLDGGKKEASDKPAAAEKPSAAPSAGATTQFISRDAMQAALAELKGGTKPQATPVEPEAKAPAEVPEKKADERKAPTTPVVTLPPDAAQAPSQAAKSLETAPMPSVPSTPPAPPPVASAPPRPAAAPPPVSTPPAAPPPVAAEPVAPPAPAPAAPQPAPAPAAAPVAPAKPSASVSAVFADVRAKLDDVEGQYGALEQKVAQAEQKSNQAEQTRAAWRTSISGAVLQLKAVAAKDMQAQQELDYEGLARLVGDLVANPRDIELISALARRAQALKRVMELHRVAMEAVNDATKGLDPLLGQS